MLRFINSTQYPTIPNCTSVGSPVVSEVLKTVKPRYHFAASMVCLCDVYHQQNIFYERLPYRNENQHITRLVYLGPVKAGSDKSRKWLHALNLVPCLQMPERELTECDSTCTASPFDTPKRPSMPQGSLSEETMKRIERETPAPQQNFRFAMQSTPGRSECWCCLAAPKVEKQLIVRGRSIE